MIDNKYSIITGKDRIKLLEKADEIIVSSWPEFMLHDTIANKYWDNLYKIFPEYQFVLIKKGCDDILAVGNSIPLSWNNDINELPIDGWDWAIAKGFTDYDKGRNYTVLCALSISVPHHNRGKGFSYQVIRYMKSIAKANGLKSMIAPVRPNLKCHYPLISIEKYILWHNEKGLSFDAWIRVHAGLGAKIVKVCKQSMRIIGSVSDWEDWTNMCFPESGTYIVPDALVPIEIDLNADTGTYIEPNVWMCHPIN
ncbi:MAG: GNAT family N-acetyltransferase [Candidatus Cloacimonetes bacterium]|nr:GNAT family N-acetyltransferase [Candidatus Cloacimonadota bacterium]